MEIRSSPSLGRPYYDPDSEELIAHVQSHMRESVAIFTITLTPTDPIEDPAKLATILDLITRSHRVALFSVERRYEEDGRYLAIGNHR